MKKAIGEVNDFYKKALVEAKKVTEEDINLLNHRFPEFRYYFQNKFIKGLEITVNQLPTEDMEHFIAVALEVGLLFSQWDEWYLANIYILRNE